MKKNSLESCSSLISSSSSQGTSVEQPPLAHIPRPPKHIVSLAYIARHGFMPQTPEQTAVIEYQDRLKDFELCQALFKEASVATLIGAPQTLAQATKLMCTFINTQRPGLDRMKLWCEVRNCLLKNPWINTLTTKERKFTPPPLEYCTTSEARIL